MDGRMLILVWTLALVFSDVHCYTKADMEAKLNEVEEFIKETIPQGYLLQLSKDSESYLNKAHTSSSMQCIYDKSKWYLMTYFDPLMDGFIQYQLLALDIDQFEDKISNMDYNNQSAASQLYQEIDGHKNKILKDHGVWVAYMQFTISVMNDQFENCLQLK